MNRNKRPMTNTLAKKKHKEVRSAQAKYPARKTKMEPDPLTEKELYKMYPKRKAPKTAKKKTAPKRKIGSKVSKRTTCGTVSEKSPPASIHREGKVWAKTLVKQSVSKRKTLSRAQSKR
ncbi:MAG: hypothetical protein K2P51_01680 [Rhabdochlamydiaceae bacterium]|nr:hypothetical protein [Rhabdochlamydiaceae bacterium]